MINIDYSELTQLDIFVSDLEQRFSDLTPFWNDFAAGLISGRAREVFGTEGYGTWAPLHPAYAQAKAETHPGLGVLQRTGTYLAAATEVEHPGNVFVVTPTEMMYGVDEAYLVSQFGENYPERHELGSRRLRERQVFRIACRCRFRRSDFRAIGAVVSRIGFRSRRRDFPMRRIFYIAIFIAMCVAGIALAIVVLGML